MSQPTTGPSVYVRNCGLGLTSSIQKTTHAVMCSSPARARTAFSFMKSSPGVPPLIRDPKAYQGFVQKMDRVPSCARSSSGFGEGGRLVSTVCTKTWLMDTKTDLEKAFGARNIDWGAGRATRSHEP